MAESLIHASNLSFTYKLPGGGDIPALENIDLSIASGKYLVILGQNGSGKSTLAKCLSGLLMPTQGTVKVLGWDTHEASLQRKLRATVGMVLQNPDNQFVATVVEEEVAFGAENLGLSTDLVRARVDQALSDTGLADLCLANPHTLSAGQKARLAIAGILAMSPKCLVLDESTAMLDPASRLELLALLRRLHHAGLAIIMITHYMDEATEADRVVVLDAGRIVLLGTPREVFAQSVRLDELGLELPPVPRLGRSLVQRGLALGMPLSTQELVQAYRGGRNG
ncbi:MAG: ATP-binding cassette domain-containing protein [Anaerolineae bacterium]